MARKTVAGRSTTGDADADAQPGERPTPAGLTPDQQAKVDRMLARVKALPPLGDGDPDVALYDEHSLRAGFLTSAAATGASLFKMRDQSRHESLDVLAGYVRDADLFKDHAGAGFL
ncbi:site-specific integrase [Azospirillum canadense]|uniref:hypothetical protein n=1 Tax=Azospirillum canadense TaxID=403962 RepID=UPI002227E9B6|nr:hypothetical protein [Azospirillum canadense]MCW2239168.1 hypothetical protein [Azospirillum canadense]